MIHRTTPLRAAVTLLCATLGTASVAQDAASGADAGAKEVQPSLSAFGIVIAPTNAWLATIPTFNYPPASNPLPPEDVSATFMQKVLVSTYTRDLPIVALAGLLVLATMLLVRRMLPAARTSAVLRAKDE